MYLKRYKSESFLAKNGKHPNSMKARLGNAYEEVLHMLWADLSGTTSKPKSSV